MLFNYVDLIFIELLNITKLDSHIERNSHFIFNEQFYYIPEKNPESYLRYKQVVYSFMERIASLSWCPLRMRVIGSPKHYRRLLLTSIDLKFYFHFFYKWN